jgi:hypothetical protein
VPARPQADLDALRIGQFRFQYHHRAGDPANGGAYPGA